MKIDRTDPAYKNAVDDCVNHLKNGETIIYPSDSLWGLGCDATNLEAVAKINQIKGRPDSKSLISLVSSVRMLQNMVVEIPEMAWQILDITEDPITIVYPSANKSFQHLASDDGKIAVRLVNEGFAHDLIQRYGKPLISTSANLSGEKAPLFPEDIEERLIELVDFQVEDLNFKISGKPSKLLIIEMDGQIKILR